MSWSPNVADLPVTGEKPISSQKWKNVVYDIYNKLNTIRLLNTGVVEPVDAETGMPWVDTSNGITLKLYNALDLQWHALAFYSDLLASNVVVTPSGNLSASDVQAAVIELQADIDTRLLSADAVTEATANKVLRLNADSKLPASITGDADTVDGKHADYFALSSDVVTEATADKLLKLDADGKLPTSITGDADTVDGKHATAFQEVAEKDQPGGYAGLDNNGALNSKIRSTYISDFNAATIGGLYYWGASSLNAPLNSSGIALVIDRLSNSGLTQIANVEPTRILYIRFSTNTSNTEWTDWKRLDETTWGSISGTLADQTDLQTALTDLQSALDGKQSVSEKDQPGGYVGLDANGKIDVALISPAMTGSATLNGTTDNTVQLTDIVTTLGLEVGDVIRIQYSGYDKLHTVESITDDNSIIVNYEHAGNRGDGSLRLADETADVTITRIAKWYNAPIGLGQAWVDMTSSRPVATNYTNTTGRAIQVLFSANLNSVQTFKIDGVSISVVDGSISDVTTVYAIIPGGSSYILSGRTDAVMFSWLELR